MMTTLLPANAQGRPISYETPYALAFDIKIRCESIGLYRQQEAIKAGGMAHRKLGSDKPRSIDNDIQASYAEVLIARLLGLQSSAEQAYVLRDPSLLSGVDVGREDEVRYVTKWDHNLIFRPGDEPGSRYWLVYYDQERDLLWVRGWRYGWEIRDHGVLRSRGRNPFWTYDYDKLRKDQEACIPEMRPQEDNIIVV